MQPYRTLVDLGSLLPRFFEVCGLPGAPLSRFGGVRVGFTEYFVSLWRFCSSFFVQGAEKSLDLKKKIKKIKKIKEIKARL